jgi:hypothetical protein
LGESATPEIGTLYLFSVYGLWFIMGASMQTQMDPKSWIALAALVVSLSALIVSCVQWYQNHLQAARLKHIFGPVILLRKLEEDKLNLMPEVAVFNEGARVGIVSMITGKLTSLADNRQTTLSWTLNVTTEFKAPASPTERGGPYTRFESFPHPFFISRVDAAMERISLVTDHPFDVTNGDYEVQVTFTSGSHKKKAVAITRVLRLKASDVTFLNENKVTPQKPVGQNLRFSFNPQIECYISSVPVNYRGLAPAEGADNKSSP